MNDTFYNISNFFANNLSKSTPVCADLGFFCPALYKKRILIAYFATAGNFVIIPFVLYLIFAKVKDGFFKYFTLNLMVICIISAIAALIIDIINIVKFFVFIEGGKFYLVSIRNWARFYIKMGSIWFHALTLYAVIVCYLPYVKPLFYSRKFVNKSQKRYYAVLHILILFWSVFVTLLSRQSLYHLPYFLTHITLFIALFIATLTGSIKISKYKPLGSNSIRVAKLQQKRLYSFILYSYSIEIMTLPMFVHACAYTICIFASCEGDFIRSNFKNILNTMIYFLYEMRTIIIISITILVLEPYRRAAFSLFRGRKWITDIKSIQLSKVTEIQKTK